MKTNMFWRPIIYNNRSYRIYEGGDHNTMEEAAAEAEVLLKQFIEETGRRHHARIECVVIPEEKGEE
jgi:hypothetical protein